jgi:hypothetical protein
MGFYDFTGINGLIETIFSKGNLHFKKKTLNETDTYQNQSQALKVQWLYE